MALYFKVVLTIFFLMEKKKDGVKTAFLKF